MLLQERKLAVGSSQSLLSSAHFHFSGGEGLMLLQERKLAVNRFESVIAFQGSLLCSYFSDITDNFSLNFMHDVPSK